MAENDATVKKPKVTPETYTDDFSFETGTRTPENGEGGKRPYAKIKMTNGKKDVNFKILWRRVKVSNWWKGEFDRFDNRSIVLSWDEENPTTKAIVEWFQKFTDDVNRKLAAGGMESHFKYNKGYKIPNPLKYDKERKQHTIFCSISLKNIPGEDYGKFEVKTADGRQVSPNKLKSWGFVGNVSDMSFEIKGEKNKQHFSIRIFKATAAKFFKNDYDSSSYGRSELVKEFGEDALAEANDELFGSDSEEPEEPKPKGKLKVREEPESSEDSAERKSKKKKASKDEEDSTDHKSKKKAPKDEDEGSTERKSKKKAPKDEDGETDDRSERKTKKKSPKDEEADTDETERKTKKKPTLTKIPPEALGEA